MFKPPEKDDAPTIKSKARGSIGHNTVAADQLKTIIGRVERLEEEGHPHYHQNAQAGCFRARGAGNHPRNVYACSRDACRHAAGRSSIEKSQGLKGKQESRKGYGGAVFRMAP